MKIYFAHPVSDYNTSKEQDDLAIIKTRFPGAEILNPNAIEHEMAYKEQGMIYFENLARTCDVIVCVPFKDGEWGMGVWREAEAMAKKQGLTYVLFNNEISPVDFKDIRPLSINETRRRIKNPEIMDTCPKLGVYTSPDGTLFSKPREVMAVLNWIKSKSRKLF